MTETIGFIGLGVMGKPMAKNLIKAGHRVVVHNRSRPAVDELVAAGATAAGSAAEVARQATVVITMLPDTPDVERVITGADGVLSALQPGAVVVDMSSSNPLDTTALAPRLAAELYGLEILKENVEDEDHNTTRFVVLAREQKWAEQGSGPLVTTFVFRVRNLPAALYKALGGFATNGVNMTKLESYMIEGNFFATQFYADVEGHPEDRNLVFAFEELAFYSKEMKILGVYPAHSFRATFEEAVE